MRVVCIGATLYYVLRWEVDWGRYARVAVMGFFGAWGVVGVLNSSGVTSVVLRILHCLM